MKNVPHRALTNAEAGGKRALRFTGCPKFTYLLSMGRRQLALVVALAATSSTTQNGSRAADMLPGLPANNRRGVHGGNAKLLSDDCQPDAFGCQSPHFEYVRRAQLGAMMDSAPQHIAAVSDVIARRHPFQVLGAVVGSLAGDVVYLHSSRRRAKERLCRQPMDESACDLTMSREQYVSVAVSGTRADKNSGAIPASTGSLGANTAEAAYTIKPFVSNDGQPDFSGTIGINHDASLLSDLLLARATAGMGVLPSLDLFHDKMAEFSTSEVIG